MINRNHHCVPASRQLSNTKRTKFKKYQKGKSIRFFCFHPAINKSLKPFWNIHFAFHIVHRLFFKYILLTSQYCHKWPSTQCSNPLLNHVVLQIFHQISLQLSINEKELSGRITYHPLLYHLVPHLLNWAVSVSPGLLIWIFIRPQMIYQNISHLALPSHMLCTYGYMRLHYMLTRWQSYSCSVLFFCQNNTSLFHNWTMLH